MHKPSSAIFVKVGLRASAIMEFPGLKKAKGHSLVCLYSIRGIVGTRFIAKKSQGSLVFS